MPDENKQKVLFFAPILEYPPAGGPQLSVVNAVKVLNRISELHILTSVHRDKLGSADASDFFKRNSHSLVHIPSSRFRSSNLNVDRFLRRFRRLLSPLIARIDLIFMLEYSRMEGIEVFWIDRVIEHAYDVFRILRLKRPDSVVIGDTEAVYSLFLLRELPLISNPLRWLFVWLRGKRTQMKEKALLMQADVVTAVSDIDADYFRSLGFNSCKVMRFSNVVDLEEYRPIAPSPQQIRKPCALLLGSFGHANSPMDRAARWVAEEIMPIVLKTVPDAHLYIIGRNSQITQSDLECDHITVVGQVPNVLPYLQHASMTLVPLRFESGTRFKIIESGAASVPCVSTSLGAEGLEVEHGNNILIADDTESFASAMISLFSSPSLQRQLGSSLHDLVQNSYSLQNQIAEGRLILQMIQSKIK